MYNVIEISRATGESKVIEEYEELWDVWNRVIELNSKKCEGFNGKGYGYGKALGMRGVMYYVDGTDGVVYDADNLNEKFHMDYTKENNIKH